MSEEALSDKGAETADDLTRRQWLLRLGEMVALVGVSGIIPEAAALVQTAKAAGHNIAVLPPGLYDASPEHLVHVLASAKFTPPPGTETDYVRPHTGPFVPQFFSPEEFRVLTRFVEIMLGDVDHRAVSQTAQWLDLYVHSSAGVRDAARHVDTVHRMLAVQFYGEDAVHELETADPQATARAGLKALHDLSGQQHGKPFLGLTKAEQLQLVASTATVNPESAAKKFFDLVRRESMRGYYTSAQGLKDLDYQGNAYYSECPGCVQKS